MTDHFYVATDQEGVQHLADGELIWNVATSEGADGAPAMTNAPEGHALVLNSLEALLDELDHSIYRAEPDSSTTSDESGSLTTSRAHLTKKTAWNEVAAARFALDCAEHAIGELSAVAFPDGSTLEGVIADARQVLEDVSNDAEHRLGRLARLSAARRMRRQGTFVSDLTRELLTADIDQDVDALDDPRYVTSAAIVDAVLAAVEAIRHLALPRYFSTREATTESHSDSGPIGIPAMMTTPWGPITLGAEHFDPYVPSWLAARDAAKRSRDAVMARDGAKAEAIERTWQAGALKKALGEN